MSNMKIRLVLAGHHPAILSGINHDLAVLPTLEVVGTAADSGDLIKLLDMKPCGVIITDYAMRGGEYGDGMALLAYRRRTYPKQAVSSSKSRAHGSMPQREIGAYAALFSGRMRPEASAWRCLRSSLSVCQ